MDFRQMLSDEALKNELLARSDELAAAASRTDGLEGLEGGISSDLIESAAKSMAEGRWESVNPGLEAIIRRFTRPVYLIQRRAIVPPKDRSPHSREIERRLDAARSRLSQVIPSTGRIDLRNHDLEWVGTGWVVGPRVVVTNRHVAEQFARQASAGFGFRYDHRGRRMSAYLDWQAEYGQPAESRFRVEAVIWIEPDDGPDVALLRIAGQSEEGEPPPAAIALMTADEISQLGVGAWVAVIGYPASDSRHPEPDLKRIFDGIYDYKRLAPGRIMSFAGDDELHHDASTLYGSSGSVVVDLASGKAVGLHFAGEKGDRNYAVLAPQVSRIVTTRAN
jgi:endonuclease G